MLAGQQFVEELFKLLRSSGLKHTYKAHIKGREYKVTIEMRKEKVNDKHDSAR